jgi:hypothetical protein
MIYRTIRLMPSFSTGELKFNNKPTLTPLSLRLGKQLCVMDRNQTLNGFEFQDHLLLNDDVNR